MRALFAQLDLRHQLRVLFVLFLLAGVGVLAIDEIAQYRARQSLLELRDESLRNLRRVKKVSDAYGLDMVDTAFHVDGLITWEESETVDRAANASHGRAEVVESQNPVPKEVPMESAKS